jgi:hypothetical protein
MEAKDAFAWIRSDLTQLLSHGVEFVHTRSLLAAIARQETSAPQVSQWADLENKTRIANADRKSASDLEMFKSVMEMAKVALTTAILVNGGAAVALLAFIANVSAKPNGSINIATVAGALMWFVFGVLLAALATGAGYLTQAMFANAQYAPREHETSDHKKSPSPARWATTAKWGSVTLVAIAYLLFVIGACSAYTAFKVVGP